MSWYTRYHLAMRTFRALTRRELRWVADRHCMVCRRGCWATDDGDLFLELTCGIGGALHDEMVGRER